MDWGRLKNWFLSHARDLPWRQTNDPYAVWISEIMLQQTQVATVIPYFIHWMSRFPTIKHLAEASLEEVIKSWEGLGYYSRARNLHKGANELMTHFNGQFPSEEKDLKQIKGLGPYTIGAILSFAFHKKKAALDGNVMRVLTRYFALEDDIAKSATMNKLRELLQNLLPDDEPWVINEALIELGAKICQRKAHCLACPLRENCLSYKKGIVGSLPVNSKKIKIERLHRLVAVIRFNSLCLIKKGGVGVMSDLYEFPYFEISQKNENFQQMAAILKKEIEDSYFLQVTQKEILPEISHSFTRYKAHLYPIIYSCEKAKKIEGLEWLPFELLKERPFSSGHRRILHLLSDC